MATSNHKKVAFNPSNTWVTSNTARLEKRSATTPATGARNGMARNCSAVTSPRAALEWSVSSVSTSQSWPMRCTQVPMLLISAPAKNQR